MNKLRTLIAAIALCGVVGCTTLHVKQTDISPERQISSDTKANAWFSSAQNLTKFKTTQTDKTQSVGVDSVGQQGATNVVGALQAIDSILSKIRPGP